MDDRSLNPQPETPERGTSASGSPATGTAAPARGSLFRVVGDDGETAGAGPRGQVPAGVVRYRGGEREEVGDVVAAEEPLEIRLLTSAGERTVAVTMRTPGHDGELAAGFLFAEGVISGPDDLVRLTDCPDGTVAGAGESGTGEGGTGAASGAACENRIWAELAPGLEPDLAPLDRHFFATSACGVCGKAGLESLHEAGHRPLPPGLTVDRRVVAALPERLREAQGIFDATGGLHAAALFTPEGELLAVREDVGRHNALDKLFGWALMTGRMPLSDGIVLVSGRSSYEILQKCLVAGVPVLCAVSAPSSLAVSLARAFRVTLVGFLRGDRFNVYAAPDRLVDAAGVPAAV